MATRIPSLAPAMTMTWASGSTSTPVSIFVRWAMALRRGGIPALGA